MSAQPWSAADWFATVLSFQGPERDFLSHLLQTQSTAASAAGGAIIRTAGTARMEILAVHPPLAKGQTAPDWLQLVGPVLPTNFTESSKLIPLRRAGLMLSATPEAHVLLVPLPNGLFPGAVAAFLVDSAHTLESERNRWRLELTGSLVHLYALRREMERHSASAARLQQALETSSAVSAHGRFRAAAMALCNHLATTFQAERVSLGFRKDARVALAALSHTEKFTRKTRMVQDIEAAMEECLDQDLEVLFPAPPEGVYIARMAEELARQHGAGQVLSLPLRWEGAPVAAVTIERSSAAPFTTEQIETLRLLCDLCTGHLVSLHRHDRWVGARVQDSLEEGLQALVGPRHTWAKATAAAVCVALVVLFLVPAKDHVEAPFALQAEARRQVPAPFDGYLDKVQVEPGDPVVAGQTVLAQLDVSEHRLRLASARAESAGYLKQADLALRDGKTADYQIALAQAERSAAEVHLLEYKIDQGTIRAPMDGIVLSGDLRRQIGSPVQTGQVLFEIGPRHAFWVEVAVPEERIRDVKISQSGRMAAAADPGDYLPLHVERINPMAELVNQRNVFKVRARLDRLEPWLQPGMEGVARIDTGWSNYAAIWTRSLRHWIRMKLWW